MVSFPAVTAILLLITNINGHFHDKSHISSRKVHQCIHDTLDHVIGRQYVNYNNHPYDSMKDRKFDDDIDRRKLISDELAASVEPIRISPYYDPNTITTSNGLTADKITYIKQLTSAAIRYFESFVSVVPVDGSLFLNPCATYTTGHGDVEFRNYICAEAEISQNPTCSGIIIPDDHLSETWYFDSATQQSTKSKDAGSGIADADLAIYVSYNDDGCGNMTLAYATPCLLDQFGRPIAGMINFCGNSVTGFEYWKFDVLTIVHELTHVLVMNSWLWASSFYDSDMMTFRETSSVTSVLNDNTYIITDRVKEIARDHFDCDTLIGAPLENSGGDTTSHWESKYINFEYMVNTAYSAWAPVSKFTLALMEDSGWYIVDYNYAEPYTWGEGEGCTFIDNDCIDSTTSISNFPQFWCDASDDHGCTADYVAIGDCYVWDIASSTIPSKFKYYSDNSAGLATHDFCGFVNPTTVGDFEKICWDTRGNQGAFDGTSVGSSTYAVDSRCVDTVASDGSTKRGYCFKHECTGFDEATSTYSGVDITVNTGEVISCSRADSDTLAVKTVTSVAALQSITCPNVDTVCGTSKKPFECFYGEYNDVLQKCICSSGYIGITCDTQDTDLVAEVSAGTGITGVTEPTHTWICVSDVTTDNAKFLNGRYDKTNSDNEGYPVYYNESIGGGMYVYYQRYSSNWFFGPSVGESANYGSCAQSDANNYPDITKCSAWYIYNQVDSVLQSGVEVTYDSEVCDGANRLYRNIWVEISVFVVFSVCYI